jgi:hypothetical protein
MTRMTYPRIRQELNSFAAERTVVGQPFETSVVIDEADNWLGAWSNDDMYILVAAQMALHSDPRRTLLDVHAGGAYGLTASEELFEALCHASLRLDGGAPWTRRQQDGRVVFGWQLRLASEYLHEENYSEAFGLIEGSIWAFGQIAHEMAKELIPRHGGSLLRADVPNALPLLVSGLVPVQGPSAR